MLSITADEDTGRTVYVFGDQTYNVGALLDSLIRSQRSDSAVADFLALSCGTLQHERSRLSPEQQAACPSFATIQDLLPYYREGTLNPALVQALVCIAHLGSFIREHNTGGRRYPNASTSCVAGVCTGALSAVAVSCSWSIASLQPLALHVVAVAMRLGALAWDVGMRLGGGSRSSSRASTPALESGPHFPPWTAAVAGMSEAELQAAIDRFGEDKALPRPSLPYIGAIVSARHASVSAPPAVLRHLLVKLAPATTALLPIPAPYHAPHLYSATDVARVADLEHDKTPGLAPTSWPIAKIPIISASRDHARSPGAQDARQNFPTAVAEAAHDCLTRCIAVDRLAARIGAQLHLTATAAQQVDFQLTAVTSGERLGPAVRRLLPYDSASLKPFTTNNVSASTSIAPAPRGAQSGTMRKTPIAILSASGRFPHADDMAAYWHVLATGKDTHELVPPKRWNAAAHVSSDPKAKNASGTGSGCWLHNAGLFDTTFFNMSPREAPQVDPAQRLALLTAAEALEQAGIVPSRTPSTEKTRVGVYFGSTSNDWMETNSAQNIDAYFIPGGNRAFIPGRINYHFKFSGPSYTIDTACSSSLAALHMACNALWKGEIDTAIVGGTNVLTNPDMTAGLDKGHFLSRTGNCKTFDDSADGYCRGEAVVTLILKRLPDAQSDKDPIQACILGVATNHNAEAESITRPHVGAQKELFQRLLAETGVDKNDISYVEMHGTGTQAGDAGETTSVAETLSPLTSKGESVRPASQPLHIGAAKANVGHGEAAAGVTSIAKVLLMLQKSQIPPHAGIKTVINHKLPDLAPRNTHIARTLTPWPRPEEGQRRVLINNFSAAGGNTAIILEDAPRAARSSEAGLDPRTEHIVVLSAKTAQSLNTNLSNLIDWIDNNGSGALALPKLSYTTTARRLHHRYRVAVTGSELGQIRRALKEQLSHRSTINGKSAPVPAKAPSFVLAFTGQGAPYAGMGAELYAQFSSFAADINRYDQLCVQMDLPSIRALFRSNTAAFNRVTATELQLMHVCLQMALFRLWRSFGINPKVVVGHSLGEYAALYAAGVLSQAQVILLVGKRAQLMERRLTPGTHAMLVALTSESKVDEALKGHDYEFSCHNGESNVVLGGTVTEMSTARAVLEGLGIRCQYLNTPFAFHTSQVDPILREFGNLTRTCELNQPKIPIISPTYGKVIHNRSEVESDYFVNHCRWPVNIAQALDAAKREGLLADNSIAIEIGPAAAVTRMIKEQVPSMQTFAPLAKGKDTWQLFTQILAGLYTRGTALDWQKYHQDFSCCHQVLDLPAYGWDLKDHWMQYVNDWSLRKGEAATVVAAAPKAQLLSSSLHKEVTNTLTANGGELVMDADLNRPDLHPMVQGHKVYGVPLCTPSVYADIAMTIGNYVKDLVKLSFNGPSAVDVGKMNIQSALVANDSGTQQILRTTAKYDAKTQSIHCAFSSVNANGKITEQHAECSVTFVNVNEYKAAIKEKASHALNRIARLGKEVGQPDSVTYRFSKAMIYKMVGQLADFDPKYRGLVAITLNNETLEAAGTVTLNEDKSSEAKWLGTNPAHLDALSQLGGFVMNANEGVDLDKELFVNHGWGSMKIFEKIDPRKSYYSYVQMAEGDDKLWNGDVILFDEKDNVIGEIGGVALQGVPKRLMTYIVTAANKKVSGGQQPTAKVEVTKELQTSAPKKAPVAETRPPLERRTASPAPAKQKASQTTAKTQVTAVKSQESSKQTASPKQPASSTLITAALKLVSEEVGVGVDDLTDDMEFASAGLDSLLSLVICSRLRDELQIEIESADFLEAHTIAGLKALIRKQDNGVEETQTVDVDVEAAVATVLDSEEADEPESPIAEPEPAPKPAATMAATVVSSTTTTTTTSTKPGLDQKENTASSGAWANAKKILAEEVGVDQSEILDELAFTDIGVDSILSLVVCGRLRDELDIDLPDRALFEDCMTMADLRKRIDGEGSDDNLDSASESVPLDKKDMRAAVASPSPSDRARSESDSLSWIDADLESESPATTPPEYPSDEDVKPESPSPKPTKKITQEDSGAIPPAWSMYLQGSPKRSEQTLFLFPDGCGAATSYLYLPVINPRTAVVGFNSPFMKKPEKMTVHKLREIVQSYVEGVRARQSKGPYRLGGWSAGGILAYAIAQELIAAGEQVESLTLIDSPPPNKGLDRLPDHFFDHCAKVGIFGTEMQRSPEAKSKMPEWLMPHFKASIEMLHDYHAPPMPRFQTEKMKVSIIWAGKCAFDGVKYAKLPPGEGDTEGMKFLSEQRTDFGPGDWAKLFPGVKNIKAMTVEDEHHFSMMREAGAEKLAKFLRDCFA